MQRRYHGDFIRFIWLYLWICLSERGLNWHGYASDNAKVGLPKKVAGAVEAVASTGGQIMPPLMGAGAFIMVELTGIPYTEVILAASIPALLYFYTVWIGVNRYAELFNLRPVDASEQPSKIELAITVGFFVVPFVVLLWLMFSGYTPNMPRRWLL